MPGKKEAMSLIREAIILCKRQRSATEASHRWRSICLCANRLAPVRCTVLIVFVCRWYRGGRQNQRSAPVGIWMISFHLRNRECSKNEILLIAWDDPAHGWTEINDNAISLGAISDPRETDTEADSPLEWQEKRFPCWGRTIVWIVRHRERRSRCVGDTQRKGFRTKAYLPNPRAIRGILKLDEHLQKRRLLVSFKRQSRFQSVDRLRPAICNFGRKRLRRERNRQYRGKESLHAFVVKATKNSPLAAGGWCVNHGGQSSSTRAKSRWGAV